MPPSVAGTPLSPGRTSPDSGQREVDEAEAGRGDELTLDEAGA